MFYLVRTAVLLRTLVRGQNHLRVMSTMASNLKHSSCNTDVSDSTLREHAQGIFTKAVESVLPRNMVRKSLQVDGDTLRVGDTTYTLNRNIHVVAFGKACLGMVRAAEDILKEHIVGGIASVPLNIQQTFTQAGKT